MIHSLIRHNNMFADNTISNYQLNQFTKWFTFELDLLVNNLFTDWTCSVNWLNWFTKSFINELINEQFIYELNHVNSLVEVVQNDSFPISQTFSITGANKMIHTRLKLNNLFTNCT